MITLGLLSDTHGRAPIARAAAQLLVDHGADTLIHLGDVGSTQVIDALAIQHPASGKQIEAHMVLGNCDFDRQPLTRYAQDLGVNVHDPFGQISVDRCEVGFTHGHLNDAMQHLASAGVDYLLHGHTHVQADQMRGKTRVINPGALFRASRHTVALLTPGSGSLTVLEVASVAR